jgi:hypothetical protein
MTRLQHRSIWMVRAAHKAPHHKQARTHGYARLEQAVSRPNASNARPTMREDEAKLRIPCRTHSRLHLGRTLPYRLVAGNASWSDSASFHQSEAGLAASVGGAFGRVRAWLDCPLSTREVLQAEDRSPLACSI